MQTKSLKAFTLGQNGTVYLGGFLDDLRFLQRRTEWICFEDIMLCAALIDLTERGGLQSWVPVNFKSGCVENYVDVDFDEDGVVTCIRMSGCTTSPLWERVAG